MRIAETTRSCALVALATVSVLALAAASWRCEKSEVITAQPKAKPRVTKPAGCGRMARAKAKALTTPVEAQAPNPYRAVLMTALPQLESCMAEFSDGLDIGIRVEVGEKGRMTDLHVRTRGAEQLNDKLSPCFLTALETLTFPAGSAPVVVSTFLSNK